MIRTRDDVGAPDAELITIEILANEGRLDEARQALELLASGRVERRSGHGPTAELAQSLGLTRLATRELRLAIRDARGTSDELEWLGRLAELQQDLGEASPETRTRTRLSKLGREEPRLEDLRRAPRLDARAAAGPEAEPIRSAKPQALGDAPGPPGLAGLPVLPGLGHPSPADLARFLHLFQGREDVHARQWASPDGRIGYAPVQRPLTREALVRHLAGTETLGVYTTRADLTACFFAIDIDLARHALEEARRSNDEAKRYRRLLHDESLRMLARAASLGFELVLEDSGYKGRHLWGFLAEPVPVGLLRNAVRMLARALAPEGSDLILECFPKQAKLEPGQIGNLIKLPLGVHLRTGRRAFILDRDGRPASDPWAILRGARRHRRDEIMDAMARMRHGGAAVESSDEGSPDHPKPAAMAAESGFTEASFQLEPELRALLGGCAVTRTLVERGLERRRLTHDEQIVLRHVLGHRAIGVMAVNYVLARCPEVGPESRLQSVLAGNPMSCPKIRKRVPEVTARVPCNCEFKVRGDHYPTPLLHLDEARARGLLPEVIQPVLGGERLVARSAEDRAQQVAHMREQLTRIARELSNAERSLASELRLLEGEHLVLPEGVWRLGEGGALVWEPRAAVRRSE